jgi:hypothetical protein
MTRPAHILDVLGAYLHAGPWWSHTHPHGHPDHAASDDPEVRRLAHSDGWTHAHEHRWDPPAHHHHQIGP